MQALFDEDDKWLKKMKQNKAPVKKVRAVKLKNGKVKKGSGFRYDKKKGYDRYWSSSEEETESSGDESDGEPEFALPSSFGRSNISIDVCFVRDKFCHLLFAFSTIRTRPMTMMINH